MESCVVFCLYLVLCHLCVDYFWLVYEPSGLINTYSFRSIAHLIIQRNSFVKWRNIIEKLLSVIFELVKFYLFYVPVLVFFYKFFVEDGWVYFCLSEIVRVEGQPFGSFIICAFKVLRHMEQAFPALEMLVSSCPSNFSRYSFSDMFRAQFIR